MRTLNEWHVLDNRYTPGIQMSLLTSCAWFFKLQCSRPPLSLKLIYNILKCTFIRFVNDFTIVVVSFRVNLSLTDVTWGSKQGYQFPMKRCLLNFRSKEEKNVRFISMETLCEMDRYLYLFCLYHVLIYVQFCGMDRILMDLILSQNPGINLWKDDLSVTNSTSR